MPHGNVAVRRVDQISLGAQMTRRAKSPGRKFPRPASLPCALCDGPATQDDFCMGCNKHVCEKCDAIDPDKRPQGSTHDVSAHKVDS